MYTRKEKQLRIPQRDSPDIGQSHSGHHYVGHTHFWERAMLSRRQFLGTAAGATGIVLGSGLWMPGQALAWGDGAAPKPIPGGIVVGGKLFHVFPVAPGIEPSSITDFHGSIGMAQVQGTGTGTHTDTGHQQGLTFDTDMRFMQGVYIGVDGKKHQGTFGFI
jgi:hypothetical protein